MVCRKETKKDKNSWNSKEAAEEKVVLLLAAPPTTLELDQLLLATPSLDVLLSPGVSGWPSCT